MNIVVCVKQVPDTAEVRIDPVRNTLIRDGVPSILNPDDASALELALQIKDMSPDTTVTVISMGLMQAKDALLECLAMGADRAVLLSDRVMGGSDTWATSNALAAGIRKIEDYDLVIAGRQAIDGDTAQVGPQIAEKLDIPQATYVTALQLEGERTIVVNRKTEEGTETMRLPLPCLITAIQETNTPRYMSVPGIFCACEQPVDVWNAADVGVNPDIVGLAASPTRVFRSFTPLPKSGGKMVEGDGPTELVENMICELHEKKIV